MGFVFFINAVIFIYFFLNNEANGDADDDVETIDNDDYRYR